MPTTELKSGEKGEKGSIIDVATVTGAADVAEYEDESLVPTEEQLLTLRKVAAPMP